MILFNFLFFWCLNFSVSSASKKLVPTFNSANEDDSSSSDHLIDFSSDYNVHTYPPTSVPNAPLEVGFQVNLRNVLEVNEVSQICTLETTIRLYWKDPRVKIKNPSNHQYVTLNPKAADKFWIPDIFIDQVSVYSTKLMVFAATTHVHT
jgi:hypothetical protein